MRLDKSAGERVEVPPVLETCSDRVEPDCIGKVDEEQLIGFGCADDRITDRDGVVLRDRSRCG